MLVKDSDGNVIGRVPKDICNVISIQDLVHHSVVRAHCIFTGEMVMDGPIVGGGPKLKCVYLVEYRQNVNILTIAEHLHRKLDENDFCL